MGDHRRDAAASEVYDLLLQLRHLVSSHFGAAGVKRYGLTGETPRVPQELAEHAGNVVNLLRKHPDSAKGPFDVEVKTPRVATELEAQVGPLKAGLEAVNRETRELQEAMVKRDRAVADWMDVYSGVAQVLSGLYRLAGQGELAERIRPTKRCSAGQSVAPDDEAGLDEEPGLTA